MAEKADETVRSRREYDIVPDHEIEDDTCSVDEPQRPTHNRRVTSCISFCWKYTLGNIGEDWLFLATLGIFMGTISFCLDSGISFSIRGRSYLCLHLLQHPFLQYLGWVLLPVCLILFSTSFTSLVAPQAAGSGIPELKTILRGVVLKESLSYRALLAKIIGLLATLGTGLPLGKEGPFVHIATMTASLLSKAVTSFKGIYENKTRNSDMLAAACAVGVAAAFAAPIGGVLFSIEVTTAFFAVRNYWRGFFVAVCGTVMFRLLAVWFHDEATLTALFKTEFKVERPFAPMELFVFILLGIVCGVLGALFVWVDRKYKTFLKTNRFMKLLNKKSLMIYPALVTLLYSTSTFPLGLGMFSAGELSTHQQVVEMFSNFTWLKENPTIREFSIVEHWRTPWTGIYVTLVSFILINFVGTILASTLPVPAGIFIPTFKIGAALGRILGETMAIIFSHGIQGNVNPGGYSIAGAAALAGAVTHTVSSSVIVFELTGQITHSIPVMMAVLVSNGVAQLLQPSIFDSIIVMKKLPYLPDILSSSSGSYDIYVEDFMIRDVRHIWYGITYQELKRVLFGDTKIRAFPMVDSSISMVLLGSVQQKALMDLLDKNLSKERKAKYFKEWTRKAEKALEAELLQEARSSDTNSSNFSKDNESETISVNEQPIRSRIFPLKFGHKKVSARDEPSDIPPPLPKTPPPPLDTPLTQPKTYTSEPLEEESSSPIPASKLQERRPSRFSVTKVQSALITLQSPEPTMARGDSTPNVMSDQSLAPKSILKTTRSFVFQPSSSINFKSSFGPYATIHGGDSGRFRNAVATMMRARSLAKTDSKSSQLTFSGVSRADVPIERLIKKISEEEAKWEEEEWKKPVCFDSCPIDPAPHQLVERTNLLKVHTIFSMLGLNHAYVTAIGRLIGVVSLKELRRAIENTNSGDFPLAEHKVSSK